MTTSREDILLRSLKDVQIKGLLGHSYLLSCDNQEVLNNFLDKWLGFVICEKKNGYEPCLDCPPCKRWKKSLYEGIFYLKNLSKSGQILVNDIQDFQEKFNFTNNETMKIGVIYNADKMVVQAQNSFLKTLEEPHKNTLFVIVTQRPKKLLNTITSRCQSIFLPGEKVNFNSPECLSLLQILADLRPRVGASVALSCAHRIVDLFKQLKSNCEEEFQHNDKLSKNENTLLVSNLYLEKQQILVRLIEMWFYQIFVKSFSSYKSNDYQFSDYYPQDSNWQEEDVQRCLILVQRLLEDLESNINEGVALNDFCMHVCAY